MSRTRSREDGTDVRLLLAAFACLLMVSATAAMVAPAGTERIDLISAEFESERPTIVQQGESSELVYEVHNGGALPVVSYFETGSDNVEVQRETYLKRGERAEITVTLHAPAETGYYPQYITEHRYLAVLPRETLRSLYELHPWAPIVVVDALIGGSFYAFGAALVGRGRVRDRSRDTDQRGDVRRLLRRLY